MRLAPRSRRGHSSFIVHDENSMRRDGQPGGRPLDSDPRRFRSDARIAARMVVPPSAQLAHHRRHAGSTALAPGRTYYSQSQVIRIGSMMEDREWTMAILDPPSSILEISGYNASIEPCT